MPAGEDDGTKKVGDVSRKDEVDAAVAKNSEASQDKRNEAPRVEPPEADEFGLPVRPPRRRHWPGDEEEVAVNGDGRDGDDSDAFEDAQERPTESTTELPAKDLSTATESSRPIETETSPPRKATLDDIADRPPPVARRGTNESTKGKESNSRPSSSHGSRPHANSVGASEWSHQQLAPQADVAEEDDDKGEWQEMPAFATHRIYDDWGKVLAKEYDEVDDEHLTYSTLGGAGKGYTRVQVDDDAESATSMDDNTAYLFKDPHVSNTLHDDEEGRDIVEQMQTTKELLTEGQRIAYVGVVRLSIGKMLNEIARLEKTKTKGAKKVIELAMEATKMWGQKMMVRLYAHMEIDSAEQVMVEQLAEHGVLPSDLTPALMQNARVKNPAKVESETSSISSARPSMNSPRPSKTFHTRSHSTQNLSAPVTPGLPETPPPPPTYQEPPAYFEHTAEELTLQDRGEIESNKDLDIDIRWTILCDLFLLLIADSTYDSRSRTLLEHVGDALSVPWQEICRFEKRVTDALEMQEQADKENWNEGEHIKSRKKAARKQRLMVMGLCTVGGGLVIGLSAGLLAPVIGAGLAAGFATFGVAGTSTFLGGTGAAALIGTAGTLTGSVIGVKASNRRTGAVKTFEYKPLFNNKRTNLIVTVSGWMTGKVDDVRLPFSTIDPIMGDIYSVNWEPDMLRSTGQTIQILATEALTQTIQQILGSTILTALMAGLSVPIVLTKLSYLIDNPWTVSLARADATGLILADSLIDRNLGVRPITLVGFSLGSRVIFSCLKELAKRGAIGLVQDVYLFGSPVVAKKEEYMRARMVVSGRFVNGYATNDWILGYLFRATSGGVMRVSGLGAIESVPGIENLDVTELVPGHMAYRGMMPTLLQECGWLVDGLEFSEIEDPDPENHEKRQRELINEIEAARYVLEENEKRGETEKKSGFKAFFSRNKRREKKEWETYDDRSQKVLEGDPKEAEALALEQADVMFDVDAIRQEALKLALSGDEPVEEIMKHLQVREIESTMPALKVESAGVSESGRSSMEPPPPPPSIPDGLRQTKSFDGAAEKGAGLSNGYSHGRSKSSLSIHKNTPDRAPSRSPSPDVASSRPSPVPSPVPSSSQQHLEPPPPPLAKSAVAAPMPEIKNPNHNPWADEEEEFGKERNVQMSFE